MNDRSADNINHVTQVPLDTSTPVAWNHHKNLTEFFFSATYASWLVVVQYSNLVQYVLAKCHLALTFWNGFLQLI